MPGRAATGGVGLFACQHLTPEPMRRPAWLLHPNGARGIRSCTIATTDTGPVVEAMVRLFGSSTVTDTDNVVAVHTGHGVILIAPPEDTELMHPLVDTTAIGAEPVLAALTLGVADPDRTAAFLKLQGVPFRRSPTGEVLVPPVEAHGVALEFTAA